MDLHTRSPDAEGISTDLPPSGTLSGPRKHATWTLIMEEKVIELCQQGLNARDITREMMKEYGTPNNWTETCRKIQQLKLAGVVL